jgi:hypothetical protein
MGFRLGPGAAVRRATGVARWTILVVGIVLGGAAIGWLAVRGVLGTSSRDAQPDLEIDPRPVITSLQQLGELHTVKMTMKDVLRKSSDKGAQGWLQNVPGGDAVSKWATHNEALVVAEGSVEAGIDLSGISARDVTSARMPDGRAELRVHLPAPVIYAPNITLRVEQTESGLLWRDENLIPKAQAEAARRFTDAAEKDNILQHARDNALLRLQQMEQVLGRNNVQFYF